MQVARALAGHGQRTAAGVLASWHAWASFRARSRGKVAAAVMRLQNGTLAAAFLSWRESVQWTATARSKMQVRGCAGWTWYVGTCPCTCYIARYPTACTGAASQH